MSQNDFHERLKKIEAGKAPAAPAPAPRSNKPIREKKQKTFPIGLAIAAFLLLGTVGGGATYVALNPSVVQRLANTEGNASEIQIVNGVPYAQITPNTPMMQRLPEKKNPIMALFDNPSRLEINQRYHAPDGWIRVSKDDVNRVTPAQRQYLAIERANKAGTLTKLLNFEQFATAVTQKSKGGFITGPLTGAIGSSLDAIYFGPSGGIMAMELRSFPGKLKAMGASTDSGGADTLLNRYERLKNSGTPTNYVDFDVAGIKVAVKVPKSVKDGSSLEQIARSGKQISWKAFVLPNYDRQIIIEGDATVSEFKALVGSLGQPF